LRLRVLVVMAMEAEAAPLVARLGLRPGAGFVTRGGRALPMGVWEGVGVGAMDGARGDARTAAPKTASRGAGRAVSLVTSGRDERFGVDAIGTQPAVLAAHLGIERFGPDLVMSAGTAGGFGARGARIGDVYVSDGRVVYHDRRIAIDGFDAYGIGSYPCVDASEMATALGLKRAVISTGNAIDLPACDLAMMERTGASVKEMEAAAVAWVCGLHGVPFMAVKAITDLLDGEHATEEAFVANLRAASARLTEAMARVLEWLQENGLKSTV